MLYDRILIKYGELSIKGKNKKLFVNQMIRTIKNKCAKLEKLTFEKKYERFYILLNGEAWEDVSLCLNQVFGLHSYSLATTCPSDLEKIKEVSLALVQEQVTENVTFKVNTKRADKSFPIPSMDVSKEVSRHILRQSSQLTVDVNHPQVTLMIEIREEATYIMLNEIMGLGGLPVGVDGKGMLMISGGIDSPVAGYMIQKRGLYLEAIHFASPPYTNILSKQKVVDLLQKIAVYHPNGKLKLHVIPFTNMQMGINSHFQSDYQITIMRRMMYRIAERVAKMQDALVLVNGESLGQVASQTIESIAAINEVTNMPVFRPLVALDKLEIIDISRKIDTYKISIRPYEDCCTIFVPKRPVTKPYLKKIHYEESKFDYETLIQEAIDNKEEIIIDSEKPLNLVLNESTDELF